MHVPIPEILEKAVGHTVCAVVKSFDFHGSKDLYCGVLGYVRWSGWWCRNMLLLSSLLTIKEPSYQTAQCCDPEDHSMKLTVLLFKLSACFPSCM
jgi:hypothetical protein